MDDFPMISAASGCAAPAGALPHPLIAAPVIAIAAMIVLIAFIVCGCFVFFLVCKGTEKMLYFNLL
jgi:hypothetical protein